MNPRGERLLEKRRLRTEATDSRLPKPRHLDTQQMQSIMQMFQAEQTTHKKSKYEALMERLKEQMPGKELDIRLALIALTPQYSEYQRLKQKHMKDMSHMKPDESKVKAIGRTLDKLGLRRAKNRKIGSIGAPAKVE